MAAHEKWEAFLSAPSDAHYRSLMADIRRCQVENCKAQLVPDYEDAGSLVTLIKGADLHSINLGFSIYPFLKPGDLLEEVARSLGAVADTDPLLFLQLVKGHELSDEDLEIIVNMLSEDVVDNPVTEKQAIAYRISSLTSVKDDSVMEVQGKAISFLKKRSRP